MSRSRINYAGIKSPSGYLVATKDVGADKLKRRLWEMKCICGNSIIRVGVEIYRTVSCGCRSWETITKHNQSNTPIYRVWMQMRTRCENKNHVGWKNYGGRGIKVCKRWHIFNNFWIDMKDTYSAGLTLERLNNNLGYSKSNCYWATRKQQMRNTRKNRHISTQWGKLCISEAAERSGLSSQTIHRRLQNGWPESKLLTKSQNGLRVWQR